jgi:phage antirepressor YoqD-like protein
MDMRAAAEDKKMEGSEIQVLVQNELRHLLTSDPMQAIMLAARAIQQVQDEKQKAIQEVNEQKESAISALTTHIATDLMPKVDMYEVTMGTARLFEMSAVAKILNFRNMGRNNLFEYLKDKKILRYNKEPYQQTVDAGYFKIVEQSFDAGNGVQIYRKTMATQRGIDYIGKLLLKEGYVKNAR